MKTKLTTKLIPMMLLALIALSSLSKPSEALAQGSTNEEKFHELFTTAGYATAFGAALGAATLSFERQPENHLRYIAIGASLGFIGGSVLGAYTAFAPMLLATGPNGEPAIASLTSSSGKNPFSFGVNPTINAQDLQKSPGVLAHFEWTLN